MDEFLTLRLRTHFKTQESDYYCRELVDLSSLKWFMHRTIRRSNGKTGLCIQKSYKAFHTSREQRSRTVEWMDLVIVRIIRL